MFDRVREFLRYHVESPILGWLVRRDPGMPDVERVAIWPLPGGAIRSGDIVYSGGVGEDLLLERAVADRFEANVWAFDPTPRSIAYVERTGFVGPRRGFLPVGLWNADTTLRFHAPTDPGHVSHSVMSELGGATHFDAPCRSIPSVMRELGHDRIDVLKLNIEGAEHVVLEAMLEAGIQPRVLLISWEGDRALAKARAWTARLRGLGYGVAGRFGWAIAYVKASALHAP
ncbi:MAG TPA: FkbM family methyltransferase [Phycisphaerales bacterium]|nr:FkbM family methyltransferase [Phycisphaerales bacterium]HMP38322.1 FkbM family methyltransferase [Phycisphaerales bacterium]